MCVVFKANRGSRVCAGVESVSSPLGCDDIFTASLHVHGVPPGMYRRAGVSAYPVPHDALIFCISILIASRNYDKNNICTLTPLRVTRGPAPGGVAV